MLKQLREEDLAEAENWRNVEGGGGGGVGQDNDVHPGWPEEAEYAL